MAILLDQQRLNFKNELPIVPLRDTVVFPSSMVPITVGRPKVKLGLDATWSGDRLAVFVAQKNPRIENPAPNDIYSVGTVGLIRRLWKVDNEYNLAVEGVARVYLKEFTQIDPYMAVKVEEIPELAQKTEEIEALFRNILTKIKKFGELGGTLTLESSIHIFSTDDPNQLVNIVAASIELKTIDKQQILEMVDTKGRLQKLSELLTREIRILEISSRIDTETQERVGRVTKEAILREKMKSIEKELGEDDDTREISELRRKVKAAQMPEEVRTKAEREVSRLAKMSSYNPESSYVRTYIEWLTDLPWVVDDKRKKVDIDAASKVLDEDHYGLPKVKERILEYLAVHKLVGKIRGPIICFVGPPGVGKTSIGKSIARALGRKFVRISLGGIHDEAEIRGHRRTYVGAMPGRIIQGIKNAGTNNPVFMLDEIDKIGIDYRGDPSAALLEALDPEQNNAFSDHYLEVPYDLSNVMFITTANVLDTIPPALRDRLEVINFPGYTEEEKFQIAKRFLIPKQLEAHGLSREKAEIGDASIREIVGSYTREAGVRELEREIATIYRKIARKFASENKKKIGVSPKQLQSFLGPRKYTKAIAETKDEVGMTTGLSVTAAGGEILFVEVTLMPGKGQLILTGQLGDVMKESAQAALSYVRSRAKVLGLPENFASKIDVHIHVPEGAVPKEGPSAGIAITTALVSALTKIPVRREVGMTGEVTLRGRVLEIGGVKEKVLASHRAGLTTVILPKQNGKDLEDIPKNVKKDLQFILAEHMDEVLKVALKKALPVEKGTGTAKPEKKESAAFQSPQPAS